MRTTHAARECARHIGILVASAVLAVALGADCGGSGSDTPNPSGSAGTSSTGSGGGGGTGGTTPGEGGLAPGSFVAKAKSAKVSKVDLLFMIDNSSSMADKQAILADSVPDLVNRLIDPRCVDPATGRTVGVANNGICAIGVREFDPVKDIHIAVISSSLGAHGSPDYCNDLNDMNSGRTNPHNDDKAHLLSRDSTGATVPTFMNQGFLFYGPAAGGLDTAGAIATPFKSLVTGVGQHGCGFEASLEAVYRFLIDPDPYDSIRVDTSGGGYGVAVLNGTDQILLKQRGDFLRPDSLVAVTMLTDENDCSVIDGGKGFYALLAPTSSQTTLLPRGTSTCLTNPNDKCCYNCGQVPPPGCADAGTDSECAKGPLTMKEDPPNLRCFDQKRKYGLDFLYPVQRYVDGFKNLRVPNRTDEMVANPLYAGGMRSQELVFVTGIVGVPWQDIAVDRSDLTMGYKTAAALTADNVWADIVGDPQNPAGPVPPRDLHMIESIAPRAGLPPPSSAATADPIHGHEWDTSKDPGIPNGDLQYACVFPLVPQRDCSAISADCDCFSQPFADIKNPVCQNLNTGAYSTMQTRGRAYPSIRLLQMLQGLGEQGVVGSICPANVVDKTRDDFGYTPAFRALVSRMSGPLHGGCFPKTLAVDASSQNVPCTVIEAFTAAQCSCSEPGRQMADASRLTAEMKLAGNCFCEIKQLQGDARNSCRTEATPSAGMDGWCYVDPSQTGVASCAVVQGCPLQEQRSIRFATPSSEPRAGSASYITCPTGTVIPDLAPVCR